MFSFSGIVQWAGLETLADRIRPAGRTLETHGVVVSVLDCQSRVQGFKPLKGQKVTQYFCSTCAGSTCAGPSNKLSHTDLHCRWDDEAVEARIGHPPSDAVVKKMKSLTVHTHDSL